LQVKSRDEALYGINNPLAYREPKARANIEMRYIFRGDIEAKQEQESLDEVSTIVAGPKGQMSSQR
jgi:hypothetical protein